MSGVHRRPGGNPRESARFLAVAALAVLLPLALLALVGGVIYVAVAYPAADPVILIGSFGVIWFRAAVDVAAVLRRKSALGPQRRLDRVEAVGWMLATTLVLVSAINRGHGVLSSVTVWISGALVLLLPVYWFGGKNRLIAAMEKRAAMRQGHTA